MAPYSSLNGSFSTALLGSTLQISNARSAHAALLHALLPEAGPLKLLDSTWTNPQVSSLLGFYAFLAVFCLNAVSRFQCDSLNPTQVFSLPTWY